MDSAQVSELVSEIKEYIVEEAEGAREYEECAQTADSLGLGEVAIAVRGIAADERRHHQLFSSLLKRVEQEKGRLHNALLLGKNMRPMRKDSEED